MLRRLLDAIRERWPTYPSDWQRRRLAVYDRALGRCEACGIPAGPRRPTPRGKWIGGAAHVHHILPIRAGGRHHVGNLRLLCAACHAAAHPATRASRRAATND